MTCADLQLSQGMEEAMRRRRNFYHIQHRCFDPAAALPSLLPTKIGILNMELSIPSEPGLELWIGPSGGGGRVAFSGESKIDLDIEPILELLSYPAYML